jgi:predicted naringenin-chalcone synthase
MHITGIGTATPEPRYTKADCWEAFQKSSWFARLSPRAHAIAQAVLLHDNGIEARRLALDSLDEVFTIDPDTLHRRFSMHAPLLASQAADKALSDAQLNTAQIDGIVVSTCTGYLCPALSSYVIERLGLRSDIKAFDLVGQGCAAALPNLQMASALVASGECRHVLSVCVEVCSAAMYLDEDPGVLISACLFGDGAGAAVVSREALVHQRPIRWQDSASLTRPEAREALRFENRQGMLRNVLTRQVPRLAAENAAALMRQSLAKAGLRQNEVRTWIMHAGGRDVLLGLQKELDIDSPALRYSAAILREYGNLSSATVYFVLREALDDEAPGGWWWMSSFGAGFSCHGALLAVD